MSNTTLSLGAGSSGAVAGTIRSADDPVLHSQLEGFLQAWKEEIAANTQSPLTQTRTNLVNFGFSGIKSDFN